MRNWNDVLLGIGLLSFSGVFSLPMRNWNTFFLQIPGWTHTVFSLPMRNWNTVIPHRGLNKLSSFQPTYEELKLKWLSLFAVTLASFSAYLWGIETLSYRWSRWWPEVVFSLPMRNWNTSSTSYKTASGTVFSLPMRNWNFFSPVF